MWVCSWDLGEGPKGPGCPPPLILGGKEEMTEGRKAGRVNKTKPPPPPPPPLPTQHNVEKSGEIAGTVY